MESERNVAAKDIAGKVRALQPEGKRADRKPGW